MEIMSNNVKNSANITRRPKKKNLKISQNFENQSYNNQLPDMLDTSNLIPTNFNSNDSNTFMPVSNDISNIKESESNGFNTIMPESNDISNKKEPESNLSSVINATDINFIENEEKLNQNGGDMFIPITAESKLKNKKKKNNKKTNKDIKKHDTDIKNVDINKDTENDSENIPKKKVSKKDSKKTQNNNDVEKKEKVLSAYVLFSIDETTKKRVNDEFPTLKQSEKFKIFGKMWKNMTEEEKKPWFDLQEKRKQNIVSENLVSENH